jgi:hypothetical protein
MIRPWSSVIWACEIVSALAATLCHGQSQTDDMLIDNKLAGQYFSETASMRYMTYSGRIEAKQLETDLASPWFPH